MPTFLERIVAGETRFGDLDQLHRLAERLSATEANRADAASATAAGHVLVELLGSPIAAATPLPQAAQLAAQAHRVWGGSQPMLGAFTEVELTTFYTEALVPPSLA